MDGLKRDIRAVVMMHSPQDLNTASSLAFLQGSYSKKNLSDTAKSVPVPISGSTVDEKKPIEFPKNKQSSEDKLSALKSYRRSKGLCFKCGEK
jgi:hypothetical protein